MEFDFSNYNPKDRYKLLSSTVIPRPIALISTVDTNGILNAAPFSFFNVFAEDPATCVIGLARHEMAPSEIQRGLLRRLVSLSSIWLTATSPRP